MASRACLALVLCGLFLGLGAASVAAEELYPISFRDGSAYFSVTRGPVIFLPGFGLAARFNEGLAAVQNDSTRLWGFIGETGAVAVAPRYATITGDRFSCGLAAVQTTEDGPFGYIDRSGLWALPDTFAYAGDFDDRRMAVVRLRSNGKTGVIDPGGGMVIPAVYETIWGFIDEHSLATYSELRGQESVLVEAVIDRSGQRVLVADGQRLGRPSEGLVAVGLPTDSPDVLSVVFIRLDDPTLTPVFGSFKCLAQDFMQLMFTQDRCPFPEVVSDTILWGFIDSRGTVIVEPNYEDVFGFSEGRAWGSVPTEDGGGRYECIDLQGQVVISAVDGRPVEMVGDVSAALPEFHRGACEVKLPTDDGFGWDTRWIDVNGNVLFPVE